MGPGVRKYDPNPPEMEESWDLATFNFKFVKVDRIPGKHGWESFKFSIPTPIRQLHSACVVYGGEWRQLLKEFDEKFLF